MALNVVKCNILRLLILQSPVFPISSSLSPLQCWQAAGWSWSIRHRGGHYWGSAGGNLFSKSVSIITHSIFSQILSMDILSRPRKEIYEEIYIYVYIYITCIYIICIYMCVCVQYHTMILCYNWKTLLAIGNISAVVGVMAWCHQATSHYLKQCC